MIMSARDLFPYIYSNTNQNNISREKKLKKELNKGKITALHTTKIYSSAPLDFARQKKFQVLILLRRYNMAEDGEFILI